jgi:hypothetical protein
VALAKQDTTPRSSGSRGGSDVLRLVVQQGMEIRGTIDELQASMQHQVNSLQRRLEEVATLTQQSHNSANDALTTVPEEHGAQLSALTMTVTTLQDTLQGLQQRIEEVAGLLQSSSSVSLHQDAPQAAGPDVSALSVTMTTLQDTLQTLQQRVEEVATLAQSGNSITFHRDAPPGPDVSALSVTMTTLQDTVQGLQQRVEEVAQLSTAFPMRSTGSLTSFGDAEEAQAQPSEGVMRTQMQVAAKAAVAELRQFTETAMRALAARQLDLEAKFAKLQATTPSSDAPGTAASASTALDVQAVKCELESHSRKVRACV